MARVPWKGCAGVKRWLETLKVSVAWIACSYDITPIFQISPRVPPHPRISNSNISHSRVARSDLFLLAPFLPVVLRIHLHRVWRDIHDSCRGADSDGRYLDALTNSSPLKHILLLAARKKNIVISRRTSGHFHRIWLCALVITGLLGSISMCFFSWQLSLYAQASAACYDNDFVRSWIRGMPDLQEDLCSDSSLRDSSTGAFSMALVMLV
eukprot:GHVH01013233.1.p1 GENE.GHVH01013233.1~~GHVH01013233.1.p1  ORF type:complete len:210 (-),score=11.34 GHVH01013233.1:27-656(-)